MQTTAIVTDTNSGLNAAQAADLGVWLLPMPYSIDGTLYQEDRPGPDLFEALAAGSAVSTSQPAPGDVTALWDRLLEDHEHVIHLPMSSGLSGSWETARTLAGDYSGRVLVPDLRRISVTLLQSVRVARRLAEEGVPAEEIAARLEARRQEASIYIALDTLEPLKRGGRVTPAAAAMASILHIKPVLRIDGGKLDAFRKTRGLRNAKETMLRTMEADLAGPLAGQETALFAVYSGDPALGAAWAEEVRAAFPDRAVELWSLPLSICCHTGGGAVALAAAR